MNMNLRPSSALGRVTPLTMITISSRNSSGIMILLTFSIPLIPKQQMTVVTNRNRKCQNTGSTGELMKAVKSSGAW